MLKKFTYILVVCFCSLLWSCKSVQPVKEPVSRTLTDRGIKNSRQLYNFFMDANPDADPQQIEHMAQVYIDEANTEGINSDCAFVQMCLETGFLRFGGLVVPEMHNYCGLGAMDAEHPGEWFETEELGIRAHIQHLHAYATTEEISLVNECIDNRYKWVRPRGKATTIFGLTKTWAADPDYGLKLDSLLSRLEEY